MNVAGDGTATANFIVSVLTCAYASSRLNAVVYSCGCYDCGGVSMMLISECLKK